MISSNHRGYPELTRDLADMHSIDGGRDASHQTEEPYLNVPGLLEKEAGPELDNTKRQKLKAEEEDEFDENRGRVLRGDLESQRSDGDEITYWSFILNQGVLTDRIISHKFPGSGTDEDPYRVEYIPDDPRNPMLFAPWVKWTITMVVAFATLAIAFVSSAYSGGIQQIREEFKCSNIVAILGISFTGVYSHHSAAGARTIPQLLICRFFAGAFGSSPLTNAGGVIADMFPASQRGLAIAVFAAAPFMGPVLGPIAGGFLGQSAGWRWVQGLLAAFSSVTWLLMAFGVPETYSPLLLQRRAESLSKLTGWVYVSKFEAQSGKPKLKEVYKTALSRPWILLFREPIVAMLSVYMSIVYGTLYMLFAAYPIVYQQTRGWSQGVGGLPFLGVAIGMLGAVVYSISENKRYNRIAEERYGGFAPPEQRLPPALVGCVCIPIGLFWFAWSNSPDVHWFASVAAGAPFGFGMVMVFLSVFNYLIDSYTIFAASVLAANAVLRSTFGAVFPLFTGPMYRSLGIHWASSIPAFLALACVPAPFLFYKYGERLRLKCKYAGKAAEFTKRLQEQSSSSDDGTADERVGTEEELPIPEIAKDQKTHLEVPGLEPQNENDRSRSPGLKPDHGISRQRTNETTNSFRSHQSYGLRCESNPFDIDRVNSREAFES
ncbi:uncharacterized protein DFL_006510 [Arthrobotrys flagrans]|uniref:Major facilitator superfamily (MFS) profile domain-containing protein n=1 Tax=Arthrobotrys flagrans TaxID=97331 RepID=A0A437A0K3_ARTFL|nr:hypothetical protein DFL_006510 [Arthrobotrys flagrans]